jgi:copper resistance protein C
MNPVLRSIKFAGVSLLSLGLLFVAAGTVFAHAKVISADPAIGSTIAKAPSKITVFTAENINPNPKLSNLFVYAPGGDLISHGNAAVSLNNPKEMSIAIKPTGNGIYVVRWITVSADDGDPDQGAFVFTVKPGAAAATPGATTTSSNAGSSTTANTPSSSSGGTPLWVAILVGVLALVVGLGGGLGIARSMARPSAVSSMRQSLAERKEEETPSPPKRP